MSIIEKGFRLLGYERKMSTTPPNLELFTMTGTGGAVWFQQNNQALLDLYHQVPDIFAVVGYKSMVASYIKLGVFDMKSDEEVVDDPLAIRLRRPNVWQAYAEWMKQMYAYNEVLGNSYSYWIPRSVGFRDDWVALYNLPAQYMKMVMDLKTPWPATDDIAEVIQAYFIEYGNGAKFDSDQVMHKKQINLEFRNGQHIYGKSKLISAIKPGTSLAAAYEAKVKIYQQRGALGIISPKQFNDSIIGNDKSLRRMRKKYTTDYGIQSGQAPYIVTGIPLDYQKIGVDIQGLRLKENANEDYYSICKALNFPPEIFDTAKSTYNNRLEAKKQLYADITLPDVQDIVNEMNAFTQIQDSGREIRMIYDHIPILQQDEETKQKGKKEKNDRMKDMWLNGLITRNDWLVEMGYDPVNKKEFNKYYWELTPEEQSKVNEHIKKQKL